MSPSRNQRNKNIVSSLVAVAATLLVWAATPRAAASDSLFPVRGSANGRYLMDASGKPFLLHGDMAWSLLVQLTREEAEEYLENRRQKGFNAILVNLIEYRNADNAPRNKYGEAPFTMQGDFSMPNEKYFTHADWVIQRSHEKGILVVLNPCYTGWSDNGASSAGGFVKEIIANGPTKCDFTTPGDNGTGSNDCALVLEVLESERGR